MSSDDNVTKLSVVFLTAFLNFMYLLRRDVPVGVPLDLSTPTGMSCIGTLVKIASQTMCQNIMFY